MLDVKYIKTSLTLFFLIISCLFFAPSTFAANIFPWMERAPLNNARDYLSAVYVNGKIYVMGGANEAVGTMYRSVEIYDSTTNTWSNGLPIPAGPHGTGRFHFGLVVDQNGKIYAIGGNDGYGPISSVYMYDYVTNTWAERAPLIYPSGDIAAALGGNGKIYVFGGDGRLNDVRNVVQEYDPDIDTWTLKNNMPSSWIASRATTLPTGNILLSGGLIDPSSGGGSSQVSEYDPIADTWVTRSSMSSGRARFGLVTGIDQKIYAIGGYGNPYPSYLSSVESYNPVTDIWSQEPALLFQRAGLAAVATDTGSIYAIAGTDFISNQEQSLASVEEARLLIAGSPTPTPTPSPMPVTVTFTPSADTYVKSANNNRNVGASQWLNVQSSGNNRSLVKFNQTDLQSSISGQSLSAILRLTIVDNGNNWGSNGRTVDVFRLTSDWVEGNGTESNRGIGSGATWNCAIDSVIQNQSKDCIGVTEWEMGQPNNPSVHPWIQTPTSTQTIINNQTGLVDYDVTSDVSLFMNGSNLNFGWILKKTEEAQSGQVSFGSKESSDVPQLIVTFQP